ncbi:hypothetical protein [Paraliomyxa miuraensis]|uniref:hypothetical protein n=1 Tax=Paraliomyxa miuraensis TaxID=376150 RepID=UPI00225A0352|nr:hypothetical protein [Paraliomyxa miuraensis]MCX4240901.1 hypothetical protein [Paraliomyxa miuraensis]
MGTRFVQILRVEDFRIESGTEARPGARGAVEIASVVRVWLTGQPTTPHATVTHAFLEARSDWQEPALPRYDFQRKRIVIAYTIPAIHAVVSMLLDGVQLYCQYRELEGGAVHADVHLPRRAPGSAHEDPHWVPSD